ncbi:MAG TPA: TssQ family T6SS-associated lipoprotein [Zeimonas sp.]|nr:TssQ family T6SS-associated lipoprotein [Zeimonas sp.]
MKNDPRHAILRPLATASLVGFLLLVGGCAHVQQWAERLPSPAAGDTTAADAVAQPSGDSGRERLAEGIERYEAGDFIGAIRALNAPEIERSDTAVRVEAGKYLAFSYCVTERRVLCRKAFDHVLSLDARFRLTPAEAGHPLWGPVFVQARKAADRRTN